MDVLGVASQKGGVGKTTLSSHLAVEAQRQGRGPVMLIDGDPQGNLSEWWEAREAETPTLVKCEFGQLAGALAEAEQLGFKLAVIDTPPQATTLIRSIVELADLVLIPTRASPHDLRAIGRTIDIAEAAKRPMVFVINAAIRNARISADAALLLSQHGTVAQPLIHQSVAFASSALDGRTVGEVDPTSTAAKEISELWTYVAGRLDKIKGGAK
jgi:chromosome partitioning protein